jgi:hypothetical protein
MHEEKEVAMIAKGETAMTHEDLIALSILGGLILVSFLVGRYIFPNTPTQKITCTYSYLTE